MAPLVPLARFSRAGRRFSPALFPAAFLPFAVPHFAAIAAADESTAAIEPAAASSMAPEPWQIAGVKAAIADPSPAVRSAAVGICADMG